MSRIETWMPSRCRSVGEPDLEIRKPPRRNPRIEDIGFDEVDEFIAKVQYTKGDYPATPRKLDIERHICNPGFVVAFEDRLTDVRGEAACLADVRGLQPDAQTRTVEETKADRPPQGFEIHYCFGSRQHLRPFRPLVVSFERRDQVPGSRGAIHGRSERFVQVEVSGRLAPGKVASQADGGNFNLAPGELDATLQARRKLLVERQSGPSRDAALEIAVQPIES